MAPTDLAIHHARFSEMDAGTVYDLLRLRSEVFVVEQDCAFLEMDGRDREPTTEHLWVADDDGVVAAIRLLRESADLWSIGRVVCRRTLRSTGITSQLIRTGIARLREMGVPRAKLGSQAHLVSWYGRFGFVAHGPRYLEDAIVHVPMYLDLGAEVQVR